MQRSESIWDTRVSGSWTIRPLGGIWVCFPLIYSVIVVSSLHSLFMSRVVCWYAGPGVFWVDGEASFGALLLL
ncbi:hypothetical protein BDV37DRAFT_257006 [Aspergillus pseudonomiae]|uniref:Uncharacterized protein n=1 Tax=Aspergillus pseudonomiae TaxID=1506151 RepID=A0A5N7D2W8_9EURO|nr:uncharacterized protein BDV37DRAFT_257006 [Aspergillus pseudonomiae]KAE8400745.1 hypothetical protein BDV37DRAFT_257006 [Aspergillus pseudonomiae]